MSKKHYLYVLVRDKKPIYVGVTTSIERRELQHRKNKEFDFIVVIKTYHTKKEALIAENSLIKFNGMFDLDLMNAKLAVDKNFNYILHKSQAHPEFCSIIFKLRK